jgi:hypothetical protein
LALEVRQFQPQQQGVITVLILFLIQSHQQVAVVVAQKIRLLEMVVLVEAHLQILAGLELGLLVRETMAVQVLAMPRVVRLLAAVEVLVQ